MTSIQSKLLLVAASTLGVGAYHYMRGHRTAAILPTVLAQGAVLGIGSNVAWWLLEEQRGHSGARANPGTPPTTDHGSAFDGMGKLSAEAVNFLANVNPEAALRVFRTAAIRSASAPSNQYTVELP